MKAELSAKVDILHVGSASFYLWHLWIALEQTGVFVSTI